MPPVTPGAGPSAARRSADPAGAMNRILLLLLLLLAGLQYALWFGQGGILEVHRLQQDILSQRAINTGLARRNRALAAEVADLKQGMAAVEERARTELGMVRPGETFYQVIEPGAPGGGR